MNVRAGQCAECRWRRRGSTELGIPFEKSPGLAKFRHARRRSEIKYASDRFLLGR